MEIPFLTIRAKDFLSGLASSAHAERTGLFFEADGINPLHDAGGTASAENGLLQAGSAPTDFTGSVILDVPFAGEASSFPGTSALYMLGNAGHFYKKEPGAGAPTDLRGGAATAFTADKTAGTDVISAVSPTVATLGLANGCQVKHTAPTHGGLTLDAYYFVGAISGNTFKLYTDQALSSLVDISADAAGVTFTLAPQIVNPANGLAVWGPAGTAPKARYFRQNFIGSWNLSGTYPSGWNDTEYSIDQGANSATLKPVHKFNGNLYYGNGDDLGGLTDDGDGTETHDPELLDFPSRELVTAISDDSLYLVIATTENAAAVNTFARNKVYFWDTFSTSWAREWTIRDPFIWAMKNMGGGVVHAFGQYGVYQVTFAGGVKKILSRSIGFGTPADLTAGYGSSRAGVYNEGALLFATDTTIDTLGKLQPDVPTAHLKPFKIPSGAGTPTFVSADLDVGRVYVGTDGSKLYAYDFNGATRDSGNTAQTVYIPLPSKTRVKHIRLIFGEPLASGDAISAGIYRDEDTAATSFGSVTFAANGAVRSKRLTKSVECERALSLLLTFTSGAVKVKAIEFYGEAMSPTG